MNNTLKKMLMPLWRVLPISEGMRNEIRKIIYRNQVMPASPVAVAVQEVIEKFEIEKIKFDETEDKFQAFEKNPSINPGVKAIAFYLPQFHPFPENDAWWGKGFTEWFNVGKAEKNYTGHYQPHCPIHNGYYDLRIPEIMEEQARMAKNYGVYGFNYYFYWFAGKTLMESPLEMMLDNKKIDMPFCLTWANENWTRRWDGQENDVLIAQEHSEEDSLALIRHLMKYFADERYIKVDGKPVFAVYRASIIPKMKETAEIWREELLNNGFPGIYLVCAQSFGIKSPADFGFDAAMEFPPHTVQSAEITSKLEIINPEFEGHIYDYNQVVDHAVAAEEPDYKVFRTLMLSWDNTARKQNNSHIFHGFSLLKYKQWLSNIAYRTINNKNLGEEEKFVFINAWNEWAEGTHLEPDRKYGFAYLNTTYQVLKDFDGCTPIIKEKKSALKPASYALVLHLFYEDVWNEIKEEISLLKDFDFYITVPNSRLAKLVRLDFPQADITLVENRGRDVRPFVQTYKKIVDRNYTAVCKIHSKKSVYRSDGQLMRQRTLKSLIGSRENVNSICEKFASQSNLGLLMAAHDEMQHGTKNMTYSGDLVVMVAQQLGINFEYSTFPAGSMFWFRPKALSQIQEIKDQDFKIEEGYVDGTLPHALERLFVTFAQQNGFVAESI